MWSNRRYESASPTEIECYWRKPALSNVGTSKKFITANEMTKSAKLQQNNSIDTSTFLDQVIQQATIRQLDSQLSRYTLDVQERRYESLSIYQLMFNFCIEEDSQSVEDFITYAKEKISQDLCKEAEKKTKNQKDDTLWHELRFGRITASNVYEASRCQTPDGNLIHRIIGAAKVYNTIQMQRGRKLEELVIAEIQKKLKLKIEKSGLLLLPSLPMLGASPDGIGLDYIVEIKCPSSEKTIKNYLQKGQISEKVKGQINLQMLASGMKKGLFCVADPNFEKNKQFQYLWIEYDESFTCDMIEQAVNFWKQNVFPYLKNSITK